VIADLRARIEGFMIADLAKHQRNTMQERLNNDLRYK